MRILPDGTVEIKNKKTGAKKIVKPEELPTYGIPYSEFETQLKAFKNVGGETTIASPESQKQKDAKTIKEELAGKAQGLLDVLDAGKSGKLKGQAYKDALNFAASQYAASTGFGEGGKALTAPELTVLGGQIPIIKQRGQSIIDRLTGNIPPQTGYTVDPEATLRRKAQIALKVARGEKVDLSELEQGDEQKSVGGLLKNVGSNTKDILNSILGIPSQALEAQKKYGSLTPAAFRGNSEALQTLLSGGFPVIPAIQEANQLAGEPLRGGDIVGRAGQRAYEKPVTTLMDLLTIAGMSNAARSGGIRPRGATTTEVLPQTQRPNIAQRAITKAADVTSGGGSKEFLARSATSKTAIPQNQVLLEEGILSRPTGTQRIVATSKSMQKYGSEIGKVYENAKEPIMGAELAQELKTQLSGMGYDAKTIRFIQNYVNDYGGFDLLKGDATIPQLKAWKAAQSLEKSPPKMMKNPESAQAYRQLAKDAARIIREKLAERNPEVRNLNAKYSALADYMDNVLQNPSGIGSSGGMWSVGTKAVEAGIGSLLNLLYRGSSIGQPRS